MPRPRPGGGQPDGRHHLRTHLIALPANAYASVHYEFVRQRATAGAKQGCAAGHDAGGGTAPPGMQQGYGPDRRGEEVDRNAVGYGDQKQTTGGGGGMSVG